MIEFLIISQLNNRPTLSRLFVTYLLWSHSCCSNIKAMLQSKRHDVWKEIRQKLELHLFFTVLYWRPVVRVWCDHRPWLNLVCVCVRVCVCVCVWPRLASLHKQRSPETGKVTFLSNNWRDPTSDCTVCTCPVSCSWPSPGRWIQSRHQGVPMTALSNSLLTPPPL